VWNSEEPDRWDSQDSAAPKAEGAGAAGSAEPKAERLVAAERDADRAETREVGAA
jgi:hypothetical protein